LQRGLPFAEAERSAAFFNRWGVRHSSIKTGADVRNGDRSRGAGVLTWTTSMISPSITLARRGW
jgi:hypothetical protein